ncbi:MAG: YggS family pyridoxal phosphate-dependent enzyme [Oscillospiraceae bacterium]|nr:YggS family pyridoxal phosphate-dependent enzyme [Oscillospiraceae bacterium]
MDLICSDAYNLNVSGELKENLKRINENIQKAKIKTGRVESENSRVRIMAVTKTIEPFLVNQAISLGIDLIGENRVQEFLEKENDYSIKRKCEIHFIGKLQSNKVRQIINKVSMIQSLDSEKLALEIDRQAMLHNLVIDVLIQVNVGREDTKSGVFPENLNELVETVLRLSGLRLRGLMAIPPIGSSESNFIVMQRLYEDLKSFAPSNLQIDTLSMGMSDDYETAIAYGSTIIRLGTALFGKRTKV